MRRFVVIASIVLVFGVMKLPAERALFQQRRQLNLGEMQLDLSLREQIGQMGFVAALSGFADAAVIGSAIVALVEQSTPAEAPNSIARFIKGLRPAPALTR